MDNVFSKEEYLNYAELFVAQTTLKMDLDNALRDATTELGDKLLKASNLLSKNTLPYPGTVHNKNHKEYIDANIIPHVTEAFKAANAIPQLRQGYAVTLPKARELGLLPLNQLTMEQFLKEVNTKLLCQDTAFARLAFAYHKELQSLFARLPHA